MLLFDDYRIRSRGIFVTVLPTYVVFVQVFFPFMHPKAGPKMCSAARTYSLVMGVFGMDLDYRILRSVLIDRCPMDA